ncbi:MAG: DUF3293 domain-containing protein [Verrucomicrobiaceae bacterium]
MDLFSAIPQTLNDLVVSPPFIWPDARVLTGVAAYHDSPPSKKCFATADLISGVLVGADDGTIEWLTELLMRDLPCRICLVLVLPAAGPTREEHLRALHMLQASRTTNEKKLDLRLLPINRSYDGDCERFILPPTAIQAHDSKTGQTFMSVGSTGDAGYEPTILGSLNIVFQPDDTLRDEWRRWFQFVFESASPLTEDNVLIPHLVPAKGDPEAAARWEAYLQSCLSRKEASEQIPSVDPKTGEVIAIADGKPVEPWDAGVTELDPLAQVFQKVYAEGWLVTIDEATRIKPLTIPLKATLMGQQSERIIGAVTQRQSFSLKVLDDVADKAMEKFRTVTDLVSLLTLPLSKGNRWLPDSARSLLEKEVEARNIAGRQALAKALGGEEAKDIASFIDARKESIRKNVNEMYRQLGQGDAVPEDKFQAVLQDVENRLKGALNARLAPRLVFNRIAAPALAGKSPDENWSQPLSLISHAAETLRKSVTDPYFIRQFTGLSFGEKVFREVFNPFGDQVVTSQDQQHCKDDLRVIDSILDSELPIKARCKMLWHLTQGMPHFYFETHFRISDFVPEWPESFIIITAYATTGRQWTDAQNASADRQLEHELKSTGLLVARVTGYSPETGHAEPSWAAGISWQEACDLGVKYKQDAIYVVKNDALFVTFCDERRTLVPIGAFRERLTK